MLVGLARRLLAAEEDGVRAGRGTERELVEGDGLTASLKDALLRRAREAQRGDGRLGHLQHAVVVRHRADDNDDLALQLSLLGLDKDLGEGDGRAVDFGEEEAVEDDLRMDGLMGVYWGRSRSMDLVEGGIRPAGQKAVELQEV